MRQQIALTDCRVEPADYLSTLTDGFGNRKLSGSALAPHSAFRYRVAGTACVQGMMVQKEPLHPMYRYPSACAGFQPEVAAFAEEVRREFRRRDAETPVEKAVCTMDYLYSHFAYIPGATTIQTTAAQALRLGKGVCQDYAHIMTAVLRYLGIPARYVNGLMIGEGYTHAWVEAYLEDGWYGFDPTNNLHIDDYYIKLAHGRDYRDCTVDKGCFLGSAAQKQKIYVNVEEISNDGDSGINRTSGGGAS